MTAKEHDSSPSVERIKSSLRNGKPGLNAKLSCKSMHENHSGLFKSESGYKMLKPAQEKSHFSQDDEKCQKFDNNLHSMSK